MDAFLTWTWTWTPASRAIQVREVVSSMQPSWRVDSLKRSKTSRRPPPPYNTATMQQDASRRLGLPVGVVMRMAQTLYEGVPVAGEQKALITYIRTDGVRMSADGVARLLPARKSWRPPHTRRKRSKRSWEELRRSLLRRHCSAADQMMNKQ